MRLTFNLAATSDAPDVAFLRNAASADLVARFGPGPWQARCTELGVLADLRPSSVGLRQVDAEERGAEASRQPSEDALLLSAGPGQRLPHANRGRPVAARRPAPPAATCSIFLARAAGELIATFRLATKKPWAIDRAFFTPVPRPLYLTTMAVAPARQRQGIGRQCLAHAFSVARAWPAHSLCLDAYAASAGAGEFYRKCGFRSVGQANYRGVPLLYFEALL